MPRPSSATGNYYDTKDAEIVGQGSTSTEKESWLKKSFIGRTPSLPSTLGKKKSFFKVKKQYAATVATLKQKFGYVINWHYGALKKASKASVQFFTSYCSWLCNHYLASD